MRYLFLTLGVGGFSTIAFAGPFTVVIDGVTPGVGNTPVPMDSTDQVVCQLGGRVAAVVNYSDVSFNSFSALVNASSPNSLPVPVAQTGDPIFTGVAPNKTQPANFSLLGNLSYYGTTVGNPGRVTFAALDDAAGGGNEGVYQFDLSANLGGRLLESGDHTPGVGVPDTFHYTLSGEAPGNTVYNVNPNGNAVFGGTAQSVGDVLIHGISGTPGRVNTGALTNLNDPYSKRVMVADAINGDHSIFLGTSTVQSIYASSAASPVLKVPGDTAITINATQYKFTPQQIAGATTGGELFAATLNFANTNTTSHQSAVLYHSDATNVYSVLTPNLFPGEVGINNSIPELVRGEMTPSGPAAFMTPDSVSTAQDLYFFDGTNAAQIATSTIAGAPTIGGLKLKTILPSGNAPMVNNEWVVFDADLTDLSNNTYRALVGWDRYAPGNFTLIARTGNDVTYQIGAENVSLDLIEPSTLAGLDGDVLKDGLSDDNYLAFAVDYTDATGSHTKVVEAQLPSSASSVPEPACVGLVGLSSMSLLLRRGRRQKQRPGGGHP